MNTKQPKKRYASTALFKIGLLDGEEKYEKHSFRRASQLFNEGVHSVELVKELPSNAR